MFLGMKVCMYMSHLLVSDTFGDNSIGPFHFNIMFCCFWSIYNLTIKNEFDQEKNGKQNGNHLMNRHLM